MSTYTILAPTPIPVLPAVPARGHPTFSAQAHAYVLALADEVHPAQNALALNVHNNALAAEEQASLAQDAAIEATGAAQAAAVGSGARLWQSGGSYAAGTSSAAPDMVYTTTEPGITYRCISSVSGSAVAPKDDPTHWARMGIAEVTFREAMVDLAATSAINMAAGGVFKKTITGATTFTISGVPTAGTAGSLILRLTNGGAFAVTFWAGLKWPGGVVPILTPAGVDEIGLYTDDGGVTWWAHAIGLDMK